MTIPNLPTDNLYKFVALTGVFLFLVALIYPDFERKSLIGEIRQHNGEIEKYNLELDKLNEKQRRIKLQIELLESKLSKPGWYSSIVNDSIIVRPRIISGDPELVEISSKVDQLVDDYKDAVFMYEAKSIDIGVQRTIIDDKQEFLTEIEEYRGDAIGIAFIIMAIGFASWYLQTQIYQDRILKEQYRTFFKHVHCQSCGLELLNEVSYHKLSEEEKKKTKYCSECFQDGAFTEPDITLHQMKEKVKYRCIDLGVNKLAKHIYVKRIAHLDRWQSKFTWGNSSSNHPAKELLP